MRRTCIDMVHELAKRDPRVVFVGSDLSPGLLADMQAEFPQRHYMEGVSEANVIGMAAGLAMDGYLPYVNTIATFITRRCYEQVAVDLCLHDLPVRLIGNGGGLVYAPLGPTHMAVEDIALMRALPKMTVVAPADAAEMRRFMAATLDWPQPIYIRLAKGGDPIVPELDVPFQIGKAIHLAEAADVALLSSGIMVTRAQQAAEILRDQGIACSISHFHTIKPLDREAVLALANRAKLMVTLEEHSLIGGFGSAVADVLADRWDGPQPRLLRLGLPDQFTSDYGSQDSLLEAFGLQGPGIAERIAAAHNQLVAAA